MKKKGQVETVKLVIGIIVAILILLVATGVLYAGVKLIGGKQQPREEAAAISGFNSLAEALNDLEKRPEKFAQNTIAFSMVEGYVLIGFFGQTDLLGYPNSCPNKYCVCLFEETTKKLVVPCKEIRAEFYSYAREELSGFVKSAPTNAQEKATRGRDFNKILSSDWAGEGGIFGSLGYYYLFFLGESNSKKFPATSLYLEKIELPGEMAQFLVLPEDIESRELTIKNNLENKEMLERLSVDPEKEKYFPIYAEQYYKLFSEELKHPLDKLLEQSDTHILAYGKWAYEDFFWIFNATGTVWQIDNETRGIDELSESEIKVWHWEDYPTQTMILNISQLRSDGLECLKQGKTWDAITRNCTQTI